MSPDRQSPRRASLASSKPYSRETTPTPTNKQSTHSAHSKDSQQGPAMNKLGFPSYATYKQIEADYLDSLHPRRQAKALVSQNTFDRIWDVLHNQDRTENPQFRFWARKKFNLGTLASPDIKPDPSAIGAGTASPQSVLLHQGSIVAVQEQIYDILCFSHAAADHGGRDKTCAAVREHYTWVPKELVSKFVKACPTCIAKKRKLSKSKETKKAVITRRKTFPALREYLSDLVNHVSLNSGRDGDGAAPVLYAFDGTSVSMSALNHDAGSKSNASDLSVGPISDDSSSTTSVDNTLDKHPIPSGSTTVLFEPIDATPALHRKTNQSAPPRLLESHTYRQITSASVDNGLNRQANLSAPARPVTNRHPCGGLKSLPMSREVSLFQGLPNGWQFHHNDYAAAREDFVVNKREDGVQDNKSVPSSQLSARSCGGGGCGGAGRPRVPSVAPMIPGGFVDEEPAPPPLCAAQDSDLTPKPRATGTLHDVDFFQATDGTGSCGKNMSASTESADAASIPVCVKKPASSIIRAAAAPLSLDLASLTSQTAVRSRLAHRSVLGELSPDSPVGSGVSPIGSVGSSTSRQVSPCGDRDEALAEVLADSAEAMKLGINSEAVCEVEGVNTGAAV